MLLVLVALLAAAPAAFAQVAVSAGYVPGGYYQQPYYGGSGGYGGYGGFGMNNGIGSTPMGSYLGGMASVIRSEGQYNLQSSAAAINLEEASKKDIENQVRWTSAYIEMRKMKEAWAESQKAPPRSPEAWARIAQAQTPKRLAASELDPINGEIHWPAVLLDDGFRPERERLEQLFAQRASSHGAIGHENYNQIQATIEKTLEKIKARINDISSRDSIAARSFLNGLGHEASFPAG